MPRHGASGPLHSAGLGVGEVWMWWYNHTNYLLNSWLERTVPGYWNRAWEKRNCLTNGTG